MTEMAPGWQREKAKEQRTETDASDGRNGNATSGTNRQKASNNARSGRYPG